MKILLLLLLAIPTLLYCQPSITLRHINIVDVETGLIKSNQKVYIQDHKIKFIGEDNKRKQKGNGLVIDASGKFLIPGLWDMHTHMNGNRQYMKEYALPVFLANGITGIRSMWGNKEQLQLRDSINSNLLVAPRMIVGSPLVDGPAVFHQGSISISSNSRVPVVVDSLHKIGYDFIKVYSLLPQDIFFALATYCKGKGIVFAGHVPFGITTQQAAAAGLKSIEHLTSLNKSLADNDEQLSRQWEKQARDTSGFMTYLKIFEKAEWSSTFPIHTSKGIQVAQALTSNHTAVVPTLIVWKGYTLNRDTLMQIPALAYIPKARKQRWHTFRDMASLEEGFIGNMLALVNFLHKQDVMILAGTDCDNPFTVHGFSLHDELELYVKAGLTPLEALQTATVNPAVFLHKEKHLGTLAEGKVADMLILEKNPLVDIKNTRSIDAVISNGHLMDKKQINLVLTQLKQRAGR